MRARRRVERSLFPISHTFTKENGMITNTRFNTKPWTNPGGRGIQHSFEAALADRPVDQLRDAAGHTWTEYSPETIPLTGRHVMAIRWIPFITTRFYLFDETGRRIGNSRLLVGRQFASIQDALSTDEPLRWFMRD
jgi:hypothetical protein